MRVHRLKQPGVYKKIRIAPKGHVWHVPYPYGINNSTEEEDGSSEGKGAYTYDVRIGKVSKHAIRGGHKEEHLSDDIICECPS